MNTLSNCVKLLHYLIAFKAKHGEMILCDGYEFLGLRAAYQVIRWLISCAECMFAGVGTMKQTPPQHNAVDVTEFTCERVFLEFGGRDDLARACGHKIQRAC
jgi:hypothetical protein